MGFIMKSLAVIGILDSLLLALRPRRWAGFWRVGVERIGSGPKLKIAVAAVELLVCIWLLRSNKRA